MAMRFASSALLYQDPSRKIMMGEKPDSKNPIMKRNAYICVELVAAACANLLATKVLLYLEIAKSVTHRREGPYVKMVQPSSQIMMQMRGRTLRAMALEGICMMAKAMV